MLRVGEEIVCAGQLGNCFHCCDDSLVGNVSAQLDSLDLRESLEAQVFVNFAIFV